MKRFEFAASLTKDKNIIYSNSEADWSAIRPGSLIKTHGDASFYTISNVDKLNFSKTFTKQNNSIVIERNVCDILFPGDSIVLNYREYEIFTIKKIICGGSNNVAESVLSVVNDDLSINSFDNSTSPAQLKVETVDNGAVVSIKVINGGIYSSPSGNISLSNGVILEPSYKTLDTIKSLDRVATKVTPDGNNTVIQLDYNIPDFVNAGELVFYKWRALLTEGYKGNSIINCPCEIFRDFTPNLKLPIAIRNSQNFEEIYNQSIRIIDFELGQIKAKLASALQ